MVCQISTYPLNSHIAIPAPWVRSAACAPVSHMVSHSEYFENQPTFHLHIDAMEQII
jgi:hypothetical protein